MTSSLKVTVIILSRNRIPFMSENQTSNRKYLLELIKKKSKVLQKHFSCERRLNFGL